MSKIRIFLLIAYLITSTKTEAKEPRFLHAFENEDAIYYIDVNSLRRDGDNVSFWRMTDIKDSVRNRPYVSAKSYITYLCSLRKVIVEQIIGYSDHLGQGKNLGSEEGYIPHHVLPGSSDDAMLDLACSYHDKS